MRIAVEKITIFVLFLFLISATAYGRDKNNSLSKPTGDPNETAEKVHKIGRLWNTNSNFGRYGDPDAPSTGRPSMEWPGGSRVNYLWEGRMWFATVIGGEIRCSHADYGNYELYPTVGTSFELLTGANAKSMEDFYIQYDDLNVDYHTTEVIGIKVRERNLSWALPDFDDFIIYEYEFENVSGANIDGFFVSWVYDCDVGTVADVTNPHIDDLVDFDGWDGSDGDTDTWDIVENIDIDGEGYGAPNGELDGYDEYGIPYGWEYLGVPTEQQVNYNPALTHADGFFDEYTILLMDNAPYLRWQSDVPEATPARVAGELAIVGSDTLRGYLFPRNMSYMYDGDDPASSNNDSGERGVAEIDGGNGVPGFIGGALIYTDIEPYYETPDDTLRRVYSHQWWNWESDPGTDREKYEYMTGTHLASAGRKFMPHPFVDGAPVFDYRWMTTSGPFNDFSEGEIVKAVYASAVGYGLKGLRQNVDNAFIAYYSGSLESNPYKPSDFDTDVHYSLPVPPTTPNLVYSPYPDGNGVVLAWDDVAETTPDPKLNILDFEGYRVYRADYAPSNWQLIAAYDNRDEDVVVVSADGDTLGATNLPGLTTTFIDTGGSFMGNAYTQPVNGLPYYYAVTAYDPAKPALELPSIESPKSNYKVDLVTGAPEPVIPTILHETIKEDMDLSKITVVPNPYKGYSLFEEKNTEKIMFNNLPGACKITIFTMAGDRVITLNHDDGTGQQLWNLQSRNEQSIKAGLYLYVVETENDKHIGKFVVLR